jgi:hypothetical protein
MLSKAIVVSVLAMLVGGFDAFGMGRGSSVFAIQIGQGQADLANPVVGAANYSTVDTGDPSSQIELGGQYWYLLRDDYALSLSAAAGFFSEKDVAGNNPPANSPDHKYSSTGFKLRVGGDRVGRVGERLVVFAGPGVEYWAGHAKYENVFGTTPPSSNVTGPTTTRLGVSARIGGFIMISPAVSLAGQVGNVWGYATAKDKGAKVTWWPSSFEAAGGFGFHFGGK